MSRQGPFRGDQRTTWVMRGHLSSDGKTVRLKSLTRHWGTVRSKIGLSSERPGEGIILWQGRIMTVEEFGAVTRRQCSELVGRELI
jgi:hypothetical protein